MTKRKGRPPKKKGDKFETPVRSLGRVDQETWDRLKLAAERKNMTFTQWALSILRGYVGK